ncbi:MAG: glycosyltransferase family 39 protein [Tepidisphaeraceae bacterium]
MSPAIRKLVVALLLIIGVQFALIVAHAQFPPRWASLVTVVGCAVLAFTPVLGNFVARLIDGIASRSTRAKYWTAACIGLLSCVILLLEARYQGRDFTPKYQDEFSYLIQTQMVAHGRLWSDAHPLGDFFDSFQILVTPKYASIYFPGAAIWFAPGVWLRLPFWVMPLLASGACTALLYLILTELLDGACGLIGAAMLLSLPIFRLTSIMALAQAPTLMLTLAMIWCWLRWRETHAGGWAVVLGVASGWCAIARPVDALCAAVPIGVAMLLGLRRTDWRGILCIALGAAPFLGVQIIFNNGVTGSWRQTPFELYSQRDYPQTSYGFHGFDPSVRPVSRLPQKQRFFDEHAVPFLRDHTPALAANKWARAWLPTTIVNGSPHGLLLILMPLGLLGLTCVRRVVVFALLPMFVLLYFPYVFFLTHYTLIAAPAVILGILTGAKAISSRRGRAFAMLCIVGLSLGEFAVFNRSAWDEFFTATELADTSARLSSLPDGPAIVLFRFAEQSNPHIEPVYNLNVTNPDDARIVRAHDLGERNVELFDYYAKIQPDRFVYLFDRGDGSLKSLGVVRDLTGAYNPVQK